MTTQIDFLFEYNAPHWVDFERLDEDDGPDDTWFDRPDAMDWDTAQDFEVEAASGVDDEKQSTASFLEPTYESIFFTNIIFIS